MGIRRGIYTLFKGYVDESGKEGEIFTLSCLLGQTSNWGFFQIDFDEVIAKKNVELRAQGRKQLSRYHAADCSSCHGDFEGWSIGEQKALTADLLKVFRKPANALSVASFSVWLTELQQVIPESAADPKAFAYALLLKALLRELVDMFSEANNGDLSHIKIALIHDRSNYDTVLLRAF